MSEQKQRTRWFPQDEGQSKDDSNGASGDEKFDPFDGEVPEPPRLFDRIDDAIAALSVEPLKPDILDGVIPPNSFVMMAGHPKTGKTHGVFDFGGAWASHEPEWLDLKMGGAPRRVFLYLSKEGTRRDMLNLLVDLRREYPAADIRIRHLGPFVLDAGYAKLLAGEIDLILAESDEPTDVIVALDPARDMFPKDDGQDWDENKERTWSRVKEWVRGLLDPYPALTVLLLHHFRKSAESVDGRHASGSGAAYGAVDSMWGWAKKGKTKGWADDTDEDEEEDEEGPVIALLPPLMGYFRAETRGAAPVTRRWTRMTTSRFARGYDNADGVTKTQRAQAVDAVNAIGGLCTVVEVMRHLGVVDDPEHVAQKAWRTVLNRASGAGLIVKIGSDFKPLFVKTTREDSHYSEGRDGTEDNREDNVKTELLDLSL